MLHSVDGASWLWEKMGVKVRASLLCLGCRSGPPDGRDAVSKQSETGDAIFWL